MWLCGTRYEAKISLVLTLDAMDVSMIDNEGTLKGGKITLYLRRNRACNFV